MKAPRKACRGYVGLLHLAAMHGREAALATEDLATVLDGGGMPISNGRWLADLSAASVTKSLPLGTTSGNMDAKGCE